MPGNYHFRFKSPLIPGTDREKGAISVWMDYVDENQRVGVWKNSIFAKVTRISMDDDDDDDFDDEESDGGHQYASHKAANGHAGPGHDQIRRPVNHEPTVTRQVINPPVPVPESDTLLDVFDKPTPHHQTSPVSRQQPAPVAMTDPMNLLDHPSLNEVHSNANAEGSLLNLDTTTYNKVDSASDFLGMTATASPVHQSQTTPTTTQVQPPAPTYISQPHHQPNTQSNNVNTFQSYAPQSGPFGGLEWK